MSYNGTARLYVFPGLVYSTNLKDFSALSTVPWFQSSLSETNSNPGIMSAKSRCSASRFPSGATQSEFLTNTNPGVDHISGYDTTNLTKPDELLTDLPPFVLYVNSPLKVYNLTFENQCLRAKSNNYTVLEEGTSTSHIVFNFDIIREFNTSGKYIFVFPPCYDRALVTISTGNFRKEGSGSLLPTGQAISLNRGYNVWVADSTTSTTKTSKISVTSANSDGYIGYKFTVSGATEEQWLIYTNYPNKFTVKITDPSSVVTLTTNIGGYCTLNIKASGTATVTVLTSIPTSYSATYAFRTFL